MAMKAPKKKKPLHEYPEYTVGTTLYTHLGMDSVKYNAVHTLDENVVLSCAGNTVQFVNLSTGNISCVPGPADGGIGAVCVHPTRRHYVVCEKRPKDPLVTVNEYPSRKIVSTLKDGAQRGFSACQFNESGEMLATVAIEPDFVITLWDWQKETIVLRNKAFGSDVYSVSFNPFNDGLLVTSGMGHIKFWSMASTFTGLKLQGQVGRFGRTEISDICGFISMPDGKVVSGSESGMMLLWEGGLVKCELGRLNADDEEHPVLPCHNGPIDVVMLVEKDRIVLSAGHDGYIRYWQLSEIDVAENSGSDDATGIRLLHETCVSHNARVRCMTRSVDSQYWVIMDMNGTIRRTPYMTYDAIMHASQAGGAVPATVEREPILKFNAGGVRCVAASPLDHTTVTGGDDHTVRLVDYINKCEKFNVRFDAAVVDIQNLKVKGENENRLLLAAFADGSVRILRRARNTFEILYQARPHESPIIAVAIDSTAQQVYTLAHDKTAFYFTISKGGAELQPVGYCTLPENAMCAEWTIQRDRCLIGCSTGNIIALHAPDPSAVNHEVGFSFEPQWEGIGYRQKQKPPEKEKKLVEGQDELAEQSSDDDDLNDEEEDQGPWPVKFIRALPHGAYLVGIDKPELCYEYSLSTRYGDNAMGPPPLPPTGIEPAGRVEEPMRNLAYRDTIVEHATISLSAKTLCITTEHSTVMLRPVNRLENVTFARQLHDALDKKIAGAVMSYDERLLITVGLEGMTFVHSLNGIDPPTTVEAAVDEAFPPAAPPLVNAIAHCIQAQKELDDQQHAQELAMGKKEQLRRKIRSVHEEYNRLVESNDKEVGGRRVSSDDLVLDPEVLERLETKKDAAVAEAHLEYDWVKARKRTLMEKLRAAFVDNLLWDRFELRGFANGVTVTSFRTAKFTEQQQANMDAIRSLVDPDADGDDTETGSPGSPNSPGSPGSGALEGRSPTGARDPSMPTEHQDPSTGGDVNRSKGEGKGASNSVKSQIEKAEERRRQRIERRKGFQALLARNPKLLPDDPKQIAEVIRAERHMGNYVLKTSADYVLPDHARPTAERKAQQLILLEHSLMQLKSEFNERVIAMRDVKGQLCERMNSDRARVQEICTRLKLEVDTGLFSLLDSELPEKRFDIDEEGLAKYEIEADKARKKAEAAERAKKGFGADLATMDEDPKDENEPDPKAPGKQALAATAGGAAAPVMTAKDKFETDLRTRIESVRASEVEEEEAMMEREALLFERARLERSISKSMEAFDESLDQLYHEKLKLESDMAMADMRSLLLFREFLLLLDFKKKDGDLEKRRHARHHEKKDMSSLRQQRAAALHAKEEEIADCEATMHELKAEFDLMVAELPKNALAELETVYTRKIKRRKNTDDDSEDDDESSSSDEDEEEEDWFEPADETCPGGIDEEMFAAVVSLRERRLDQVDRKADLIKAADGLRKERDNFQRKETDLESQLKRVDKEINDFQKEKQKQLNLLETIVVLKLSQIRCLDAQAKMPHELTDDIIVFTRDGLRKLRQRISDLDVERVNLDDECRALDQEISRLGRKRSKKFAEFTEHDSHVYEVQLLKFGQRVNLELLEDVAVDRETEELKAQLKAEEIRWERELQKQSDKLSSLKQQQQQRIAENTACLKDLGSFRAEQRDLEDALKQSAGKIVAKMTGGSKVATAADRAHLKDLVVAQQQEIDALKNEIAMLRRKGGHVYTPVVNKVEHPGTAP